MIPPGTWGVCDHELQVFQECLIYGQEHYYTRGACFCPNAVNELIYLLKSVAADLGLAETATCALVNDAVCLALNRSDCLWNFEDCSDCAYDYERLLVCWSKNQSLTRAPGCQLNCTGPRVDRSGGSAPFGCVDASCRPLNHVMGWMIVAALWFFAR